MISFDEAVAAIRLSATPLGRESVSLAAAHRRVLSAPVRAAADSPARDVSTMDGYAVRDSDLAALPARLQVVGESFPGRGFDVPMPPRCCVRIFTGAPLPQGADRIVIQEEVVREDDSALFAQPAGPMRYIRRRGSDFAGGDVLLAAGRALDSRALVAAAAADVAAVEVTRRPRLILFACGDELAEPGQASAVTGAIPDSISAGLCALAQDWGAHIVAHGRLRDDLESMTCAAADALSQADLIVVTGGASVGDRDFAKAMFAPDLEPVFSKVAIRPGKPAWFGRVRGTLVLGLPGNPTSAMVTARLLLAPLLAGMSGRDPAEALAWRSLPLADAIGPCDARETFLRARELAAAALVLPNQDSGAQATLAQADLLVRRRPGAPAAEAGEMVEVLDF